uniref:Ubiquitin-like protease family profile domain-containing protein n=1 Tax=Amphimedon queenslandica TaxID=400682 RepID=A0A1X7TW19_AMPQE
MMALLLHVRVRILLHLVGQESVNVVVAVKGAGVLNVANANIASINLSTRKYLAKAKGTLLDVADFATVYNGEWLNDQIINYALVYIFLEEFPEKLTSLESTFFYLLPTTVFTKLMLGQADDSLNCYFLKEKDFSKIDAIVMPCCLCHHWILIVVNFREQSIVAYDSIGGYIAKTKEALKLLLSYLNNLIGPGSSPSLYSIFITTS